MNERHETVNIERVASVDAHSRWTWLEHLPLSFFSAIMGLAGLCIAWEKTLQVTNLEIPLPLLLVPLTVLCFVALLVLHLMRLLRFPTAVVRDLDHPVKLNFLATLPISMLLLSVALFPLQLLAAEVLWMIGSALQLGVLLFIMNSWVHKQHYKVEHLNPAWFIPAVGNVMVPLSGVPLGYSEVSWFFFSVGMVFWIVLLGIIFNRILFHSPMPDKLLPTLFILIAPPSLGFIAYIRLTDSFDAFAHVLFHAGLFFTLLLFTQFSRFVRLPFSLSSWAYSFPLASITVASWLMYELTGVGFYHALAMGLLALLNLVVAGLLLRTVQAMRAGEICVPE